MPPDQEAVVQRVELLGLGQLVGRGDEREQRHLQARVAVVKEPLVEQRQQRIEDGRIRLEDLVDEGDLGGREVAVRLADVLVVLEAAHGERAEELLGDGEPFLFLFF